MAAHRNPRNAWRALQCIARRADGVTRRSGTRSDRLRASASTPTVSQQVSCGTAHECGCGLIFGLIRLRSPTFIGIRLNAAMQVADVNGIRRTVIPSPENRKVGGSSTVRLLSRISEHALCRYSCHASHGGDRVGVVPHMLQHGASAVGVVLALLVLLPETLAAVRAATVNRLQTRFNLAYGSALASIGLTIPTIAVASIWLDGPLLPWA